jgi:hypothetical protein
MNRAGVIFLESLLKKAGRNGLLDKPVSVEVGQQENNIDVLIFINGKTVILIEDKTASSEHGKQLERYSGYVEKNYLNMDLVKIYFKTGVQINLNSVKGVGFEPYLISDFVSALKEAYENGVNNNIFIDAYHHFSEIDRKTNCFHETAIEHWKGDSRYWKGLFQYFDSVFSCNNINNDFGAGIPRDITGYGSGLGFYFGWNKCVEHGVACYFRYVIKTKKLVVKIGTLESDSQAISSQTKELYRDRLKCYFSNNNIDTSYANSNSKGKTATILNVSSDLVACKDGYIDRKQTGINLLNLAMHIQDFDLTSSDHSITPSV